MRGQRTFQFGGRQRSPVAVGEDLRGRHARQGLPVEREQSPDNVGADPRGDSQAATRRSLEVATWPADIARAYGGDDGNQLAAEKQQLLADGMGMTNSASPRPRAILVNNRTLRPLPRRPGQG